MKISIIGSGNVATVLGRIILRSGEHSIQQIIARNESSGRNLALELGAEYSGFDNINFAKCEVVIICTSDDFIAHLPLQQFLNELLLVHTAGAVSKDILKKYAANYGVFYPLQSMRKELPQIPKVPFLIDANTGENLKILEMLCASLKSDCRQGGDEERLKMHTAAVVVSNFTNHLYSLTEKFCSNQQLDFSLLQPLIEETATRLRYAAPGVLQTGPAIRKDLATINRHLSVLDDYPKLRNLYQILTTSILGN